MIQNAKQLAKTIDYTLLSATACASDIAKLCSEAKQWGFFAVCVHPRWVSYAVDQLGGSDVKVVSVAGFPFGTNMPKIKAAEAREVIFAGADEVDIVADLASVIGKDGGYLRNEFVDVLKVCKVMKPPVVLKVIIEAAALSPDQIQFVCEIASDLGVDFVKTSTGFNSAGGARVEDVKLMKQFAPRCKIKAAGGIKTAKQALDMLDAGAERLGCSAAIGIIEEFSAMLAGSTT